MIYAQPPLIAAEYFCTWPNYEQLFFPFLLVDLCTILIFHVTLAITSPWFAPYDYKAINPTLMLNAPSSEFWFGPDSLGRDVFVFSNDAKAWSWKRFKFYKDFIFLNRILIENL